MRLSQAKLATVEKDGLRLEGSNVFDGILHAPSVLHIAETGLRVQLLFFITDLKGDQLLDDVLDQALFDELVDEIRAEVDRSADLQERLKRAATHAGHEVGQTRREPLLRLVVQLHGE